MPYPLVSRLPRWPSETSFRSDAGRRRLEELVEVGTEEADRDDDNDGDQGDHQSVLNFRGTALVAKAGHREVKLQKWSEHDGSYRGSATSPGTSSDH